MSTNADAAAPNDELLSVLAGAPSAVIPIREVPDVLGLDPVEASNLVAAWVDSGLVEVWNDFHRGAAIVLSSETAARLGLVLIERGDGLAWERADAPPRKDKYRTSSIRGVREVLECDLVGRKRDGSPTERGLDDLPDPSTTHPPRVNAPHLILGIGRSWPVAPVGGRCGVGHPEKLPPGAYCGWCDRMADEHLLEEVRPSERPKAYDPKKTELRGGRGKTVKRKRKKGVAKKAS